MIHFLWGRRALSLYVSSFKHRRIQASKEAIVATNCWKIEFTSKAKPTVVTDIEDMREVMEHLAIPMVRSKKRKRLALPNI